MAFKLHGMKGSWCTLRVLAALSEAGLTPGTDFEFINVDLNKGEHKSPAVISLQPFGKIPVLEDDGFVLYESRAMARYIMGKYGKGKLLAPSADVQAMAKFEQAACIETEYFNGIATDLIRHALMYPVLYQKPRDEEKISSLRDQLGSSFDIIDSMLQKQKYMAGDEYSLVDLFYCPLMWMLMKAGQEEIITKHSALAAWWKTVSGRETWKSAVEESNAVWAAFGI